MCGRIFYELLEPLPGNFFSLRKVREASYEMVTVGSEVRQKQRLTSLYLSSLATPSITRNFP